MGQMTPAKNVIVGDMNCAGRMLGPTTFHNWCYKGGKLVINSAIEMVGDVNTTYFADSISNNQIQWVITTPNLYTVNFRVGTSGIPHTMSGTF
jgi:hypothetical protein